MVEREKGGGMNVGEGGGVWGGGVKKLEFRGAFVKKKRGISHYLFIWGDLKKKKKIRKYV